MVSLLHILLALLFIFGGATMLAVSFVIPEMFPHIRFAVRSATLGIALVILAVIDFILAYGLWTGRRWAWIASLAFAVLGIVITVLSLFGRPGLGAIFALILYLLVIYYLMQPRVHAFLVKRSPTCTAQ